jgi:hypothetical protein
VSFMASHNLLRTFLLISLFVASGPVAAIDAKQLAAQALHTTVIKAVSLTTRSGEYIAALARSDQRVHVSVVLLQKVGSLYVEAWRTPPDFFFGEDVVIYISDANNDGQPEVMFIDSTAGSGGGTQRFSLFDSHTRKLFLSEISYLDSDEYNDTVEYDHELLDPSHKPLLDEVVAKLEKSPRFQQVIHPDASRITVHTWIASYGAINTGEARSLHIKPVKAPLSSCTNGNASVTARLKVGGLIFLSYFKDGVFAFDDEKKACWLVYYPVTAYHWIETMRVVKGWVALIANDNTTTRYYNPKTGVMSVTTPK